MHDTSRCHVRQVRIDKVVQASVAGKQAKKDIVLLAMQSTVAASHALSAQGAVRMALWAELSTRHGITFDSLVYLLPRSRYAGWAPQDGVPAGLVQLAWAL